MMDVLAFYGLKPIDLRIILRSQPHLGESIARAQMMLEHARILHREAVLVGEMERAKRASNAEEIARGLLIGYARQFDTLVYFSRDLATGAVRHSCPKCTDGG